MNGVCTQCGWPASEGTVCGLCVYGGLRSRGPEPVPPPGPDSRGQRLVEWMSVYPAATGTLLGIAVVLVLVVANNYLA